MGRLTKYYTVEEKKEAQRLRKKAWDEKNKLKIKAYDKERYLNKKKISIDIYNDTQIKNESITITN
jgi:hypothetical protein